MRKLPKNFKEIKFKKHEMPAALLRQVDENSKSFILFCISDTDDVKVFSNITSQVNAIALANKCLHYGNIINMLDGQQTFQDITNSDGSNE